jgi:hypothetical protein
VGWIRVRAYVRTHVGRWVDMPTFVASSHAAARRSGCACMRLPAIAGGWMLGEARGKRQEARGAAFATAFVTALPV